MKKRFRKIVVGGKEYAYNIKNGGDGDGGNVLRIWFNKKMIHETEDSLNGEIIITPKFVAEFIISNGL